MYTNQMMKTALRLQDLEKNIENAKKNGLVVNKKLSEKKYQSWLMELVALEKTYVQLELAQDRYEGNKADSLEVFSSSQSEISSARKAFMKDKDLALSALLVEKETAEFLNVSMKEVQAEMKKTRKRTIKINAENAKMQKTFNKGADYVLYQKYADRNVALTRGIVATSLGTVLTFFIAPIALIPMASVTGVFIAMKAGVMSTEIIARGGGLLAITADATRYTEMGLAKLAKEGANLARRKAMDYEKSRLPQQPTNVEFG